MSSHSKSLEAVTSRKKQQQGSFSSKCCYPLGDFGTGYGGFSAIQSRLLSRSCAVAHTWAGHGVPVASDSVSRACESFDTEMALKAQK